MHLLQIHYRGDKPRTILLLLLAQTDEHYIGIDTQQVSDDDRELFKKAAAGGIKVLSVDWIRKNCPKSYNKGYRKLRKDKCKLVDKHEL